MLHLKIRRRGREIWYPCNAANPDDALTELAIRGRYDFDAGDRLLRVIKVNDTEAGHMIGAA